MLHCAKISAGWERNAVEDSRYFEAENAEIWKKSGENPKRYESMVLAASVVFPDLKGADLQDSYGVMGAENLLEKMLTAGEFSALQEAVEAVNQ